jgi:hypothetical protein
MDSMNRNKLKTYAPEARRDFIQAMTDRAAFFGLTAKKVEPVVVRGDVAVIAGRDHPRAVADKRKKLEARIARDGFEPTMEAMAYTWFNRLVAIRFMELHGYLDHGYRVLSHPDGKLIPEILEHAEHVELPGLKKDRAIDMKLEGDKESELYRLLLTAQCNALHKAMPFLFERIDDETELLLPDNLLHSDSLVRKLVDAIDEEDWKEVEIIGWLYQFYISEKKDEVIGKVLASADIPAATQLFTPNWIVKYLVQNTLGRQWLATYPSSPLRAQMEFYIEPAEQPTEVKDQLKAITPTSLDPEELTMLDPACGSCHILVEGYDLFKEIYLERGYRRKDIPALILQKNLFGLEIDDRAAQLGAFALMMKARADDRRIFESGVEPCVVAIRNSQGLNADSITNALNAPISSKGVPSRYLFEEIDNSEVPLLKKQPSIERTKISRAEVVEILATFINSKTFGSLIKVAQNASQKIEQIEQRLDEVLADGDLTHVPAADIKALLKQAKLLCRKYDVVVANPPYIGSKGMNPDFKEFAASVFPRSKYNTYCMFIERLLEMIPSQGRVGMVTLQGWLFQERYARFRKSLLDSRTLTTMAHLGPNAFPEISGEVVQSAAFVVSGQSLPAYVPTFFALYEGDSEEKAAKLRDGRNPITDISFGEFDLLPGDAFLYWASARSRELFRGSSSLASFVTTREGMTTADNNRFLRFFWEVDSNKIERCAADAPTAVQSGKRWFPYVKGGEFRKWFGNDEMVVNWYNDGEDIKAVVDPKTSRIRSHNYNGDYGFRPGLTWSSISSSAIAARFVPTGFMFDTKGPMVFCATQDQELAALGIINSKVGFHFMRLIAPSLDFKLGHVESIPFVGDGAVDTSFVERVRNCVEISRIDWSEQETSPQFSRQPLASVPNAESLEAAWSSLSAQNRASRNLLRGLEEANNRVLIAAYGLQGELQPEISEDQITLYRPTPPEDIKRLLSYAIGCVMGRFSLDAPGLVYAGSGNRDFDPTRYRTFQADSDAIVPVLDADWGFQDEAVNRLVEFLTVLWPVSDPEVNLKFAAANLGPISGEQPRDTIRRYFATAYYKHHLLIYRKRPIYWQFSSGLNRAFQCLVYLHRYSEGTLARMRTEYVIPLQGRIAARIEQIEGDKTQVVGTSHRKKLQKEQDDLKKKQAELRNFEEKLKHFADKRLAINLDDGVKANYGKFGDLLAEAKAVTGGKDDE